MKRMALWLGLAGLLGITPGLSGHAVGQAQEPVQEPVVVIEEGLAGPESVEYDDRADLYLISNINGGPADRDGNGFISRVSPDGEVVDLRWISGEDGAELNAPKGLALADDTLYVADIDTVRMFDRETGEPRGSVLIEGAMFLNGITAAPDGAVYVTDTGVDAELNPTETEGIYRITPDGNYEAVVQSPELTSPNGIAARPDGALLVVTFVEEGTAYEVRDGMQGELISLPSGQLDGVVVLPDGSALITSWGASAIFRLTEDGEVEIAITGTPSAADIGWDSSRQRVLVPLLQEDRVVVYELPQP